MSADSGSLLYLLRDLLNNLRSQLAPLTELASPSAIKWSGIVGIAAFLVAYLTMRRGGGRKPDNPAEASNAESSQGIVNGPSGGCLTQAVRRGASSATQTVASAPSTLTKRIRRRLKGVKKVTCSLPGVLFEDNLATATVKADIVEVLQALAGSFEVYFITLCSSDSEQEQVHNALRTAELIGPERPASGRTFISDHRSLYCSTVVGCTAIVRQLEPDLHIEGSSETVASLARFIPRLLHVQSPNTPSASGSANITSTSSLDVFFGGVS